MGKGVEFSPEVYERILKLSAVFNMQEVAEALNVSKSTVYRIVTLDKLAKAGEVDKILNDRNMTMSQIQWAVEKYGLKVEKKTAPAEGKNDSSQAVEDKNIEALIAAISRINGNLVNLSTQIAEVGQMLKMSINANADMLYQQLDVQTDYLISIENKACGESGGKE